MRKVIASEGLYIHGKHGGIVWIKEEDGTVSVYRNVLEVGAGDNRKIYFRNSDTIVYDYAAEIAKEAKMQEEQRMSDSEEQRMVYNEICKIYSNVSGQIDYNAVIKYFRAERFNDNYFIAFQRYYESRYPAYKEAKIKYLFRKSELIDKVKMHNAGCYYEAPIRTLWNLLQDLLKMPFKEADIMWKVRLYDDARMHTLVRSIFGDFNHDDLLKGKMPKMVFPTAPYGLADTYVMEQINEELKEDCRGVSYFIVPSEMRSMIWDSKDKIISQREYESILETYFSSPRWGEIHRREYKVFDEYKKGV